MGTDSPENEKTMPFWDHLLEIRRRLLVVLGSILLFSILGYGLFPVFYASLTRLLGETLYATTIAEGFAMRVKIAFLFGAVLSLPVLISEIALFLLPALKKSEKTTLAALLVAAFALFVSGVVFAYGAVLPAGLAFLKSASFFPGNLGRLISYESFFGFVFKFLFGFGLCFQFPVVVLFLLKLGILKTGALVKSFRYVVILILAVAAVITPSVDIASQLMLALPMTVMYALSILVAKLFRLGR